MPILWLRFSSRYFFRLYCGIEFSPELYLIAQKNIGNCLSNNHFNTEKINLIQKDVLDYVFNHHETVFYLYNPFSNKILNMITKQQLMEIVQEQAQLNHSLPYKPVDREVLSKIEMHLSTPHAVIITGIRRCGKSTLTEQISCNQNI